MPASIKQRILTGTRAYLAERHAQDPALYPAEVKSIAAHIGVSRGTFYNWLNKDDSDMAELFREIEAADARAVGGGSGRALALTPGDHPEAGVPTAELEREIREGLERVVWAMRGFLSLMDNSSGVSEAPLLMAELDAKLKTCRAVYHDLEGPYHEWRRRRTQDGSVRPSEAEDAHRERQFGFDLDAPEDDELD